MPFTVWAAQILHRKPHHNLTGSIRRSVANTINEKGFHQRVVQALYYLISFIANTHTHTHTLIFTGPKQQAPLTLMSVFSDRSSAGPSQLKSSGDVFSTTWLGEEEDRETVEGEGEKRKPWMGNQGKPRRVKGFLGGLPFEGFYINPG